MNNCGLCGQELLMIETLLGVNKLSDGNIICNKCLEKASNINQNLLHDFTNYSLDQIKEIFNEPQTKTQEVKIEDVEIQDDIVSSLQNSFRIPKMSLKEKKNEIEKQLKAAKANLSAFTRGEIKELPEILEDDEIIVAATDARHDKSANGLLLVTQKNMIYVRKIILSLPTIKIIPNEKIQSVSLINDPISPKMKVETDKDVLFYEFFCEKKDGEEFYFKIQDIYNNTSQQNQTTSEVSVEKHSSEQVFEQLEKLGSLREKGILTEHEFLEQKKKLLEKL